MELNLGSIKQEYESILQQLSDPELISNWEKFEELSKRKNYLEKIIEKNKEIEEIENKIEENKIIIAAKEDPELVFLAETEIAQLQERKKLLEKEMASLIKNENKEEIKPASVIVEIRAGTGGEEAALFAADLFKMYLKYAESQGWHQSILDSHPTELGGFKEIIFELKDGDVFSKMKYEAGVHRVQRIPITEKGNRVHTSTASVAVLPKPKISQIKINPQELQIDFYRASGPGGQYVNRRETAVRITHLPTGIVVTSQTERNQLQNKENALKILEARLLERKQMIEEEKISGERKAQIGWAKRAEKIRTYNFPQDRITDHRIKKSWHNIEKILNGELEPVILALQKSQA
jgi:peptide chain release factor 1